MQQMATILIAVTEAMEGRKGGPKGNDDAIGDCHALAIYRDANTKDSGKQSALPPLQSTPRLSLVFPDDSV